MMTGCAMCGEEKNLPVKPNLSILALILKPKQHAERPAIITCSQRSDWLTPPKISANPELVLNQTAEATSKTGATINGRLYVAFRH